MARQHSIEIQKFVLKDAREAAAPAIRKGGDAVRVEPVVFVFELLVQLLHDQLSLGLAILQPFFYESPKKQKLCFIDAVFLPIRNVIQSPSINTDKIGRICFADTTPLQHWQRILLEQPYQHAHSFLVDPFHVPLSFRLMRPQYTIKKLSCQRYLYCKFLIDRPLVFNSIWYKKCGVTPHFLHEKSRDILPAPIWVAKFPIPRTLSSSAYPYPSLSPRRGRASRCPHRRSI